MAIPTWRERARIPDPVILGALLALAAVLRFVDLPTRGMWDADQGHDMLVLTRFVEHGAWPLLGPPTSIGTFHHGALYYYALAPAAWLGGGDPTVVVAEIALLGALAVGLVWWIGRSMAGPVAGLVAGLVAAVSASAIDESTFIWNPNLIAFSSALTIACAWQAWMTRRPIWWLGAAIGLAMTMQFHVLGAVFLVPVGALMVADARRRPQSDRGGVVRLGLLGTAIVVASYLPLAIHELGHDFTETRAAIAYLMGGGEASQIALVTRLLVVGLRIIAWPLTGLLTDALAVGVVAAVLVVGILVWRLRTATGLERTFVQWVTATLVWCWLALGFGVASLATVTPLPVDHYHAFVDPLVFVIVGLGAAALWGSRGRKAAGATGDRVVADRTALIGPVAVVGLVGALVGWNVATWPPAVAADGGWPAAQAAADRIEESAAPGPIALLSLPTFKTAEAYEFPLDYDGRATAGPAEADTLVVVSDSLFIADCGGPAERAAVAATDFAASADGPVDRFEAAPGRTISVYLRR